MNPITLFLVSGAPGAGKSAIANALLADPTGPLVFDLDWLLDAASDLAGTAVAPAPALWPAYNRLWLDVLAMIQRNRRPALLFSPLAPNDVASLLPAAWVGAVAWCLLDCDDAASAAAGARLEPRDARCRRG